MFKGFCNDNEEDFDNLILHTEVRWLSKGNCLERFLAVFHIVIDFFSKKDSVLANDLKERKNGIAYLYCKCKILNKILKGKNLNVVKVNGKLTSFRNKLELFEINLKIINSFSFQLLSVK